MSSVREYDLAGVGIGPFNLALAALAEPLGLDAVFFDEKPAFSWHEGLLIEGTTLQVPFLADLVTLADPTSRWSFLSYLREHDRLFPFYFAERFHVPRREYDHYCRWVADSLPSCRFAERVEDVRWDSGAFTVTTSSGPVRARNVVFGVGTEPSVPPALRPLLGKEVCHAAEYLDRADYLRALADVTVVGSGQSGAEVFLDLLRTSDARLRWLTRSPAFAPMEYSKLGLEHFTPEYTRYFRSLPADVRERLLAEQWQLYKAISAETISDIHEALYARGLSDGWPETTLMPNVTVISGRRLDGNHDPGENRRHTTGSHPDHALELECRHVEQERGFTVHTDGMVLATGYRPRPLPGPWAKERLEVDAEYRLTLDVPGAVFVQNAELWTHGVGTPDLGLGAYRAAVILNAVAGSEVYKLPERTAYTTFGV